MKDYQKFVLSTTSECSTSLQALKARLDHLNNVVNIPLLMTASTGLAAEGGEFSEVVKKAVYQGKELTDGEIYHMKRELGDVLWYLANACTALGTDIETIMEMNIEKLEARYPNGFEAFRSENRKDGDL